jgi:hypothetical protein
MRVNLGEGWAFSRLENGDVTVLKTKSPTNGEIVATMTLSRELWDHVVAELAMAAPEVEKRAPPSLYAPPAQEAGAEPQLPADSEPATEGLTQPEPKPVNPHRKARWSHARKSQARKRRKLSRPPVPAPAAPSE